MSIENFSLQSLPSFSDNDTLSFVQNEVRKPLYDISSKLNQIISQINSVNDVTASNVSTIQSNMGTIYPKQTVTDSLSNVITIPAGLNLPIRGSNVNGYYEIWPDGTLNCWATGTASVVGAGSPLAFQCNWTWTFPVAFNAIPNITPPSILAPAANAVTGRLGTSSITQCLYIIYASVSASYSVDGKVHGRWKA